jgi:hypothetical protein
VNKIKDFYKIFKKRSTNYIERLSKLFCKKWPNMYFNVIKEDLKRIIIILNIIIFIIIIIIIIIIKIINNFIIILTVNFTIILNKQI